MDDRDALSEQLITALEHAEATISRLVALLKRAGPYDDETPGRDVLRVQREISRMLRWARWDG